MSPSLSQRLRGISRLDLLARGSFSHDAALVLQEHVPHLSFCFHEKISAALQALGPQHAVFIPMENAGSGPVRRHLELLRQTPCRRVIAEVRLGIDMRLGGVDGAALEDVRTVYSHRQALLQSSRFLADREQLPALRSVVPTETTVEALRKARADGSRSAALGSPSTLQELGLHDLMGRSVANLPPHQNITQFYVVMPNGQGPVLEAARKFHALYLTPTADRPGVLVDILSIIKAMRVNLRSIHAMHEPGQLPSFFMEMERGNASSSEVGCMAHALRESPAVQSLDWAGSWDDSFASRECQGNGKQEIRRRDEDPLVMDDKLDTSRQFHSLRFRPHDMPGVLHDVLHPMAAMGINLLALDSMPQGEKTYDFMAILDRGKLGQSGFQSLVNMLHRSRTLQEVEWMHSKDVPPVIGRFSVSDPLFIDAAASRLRRHYLLREKPLPLPDAIAKPLCLSDSPYAIGIEDAILSLPDLYQRQEILAEMIMASRKGTDVQG